MKTVAVTGGIGSGKSTVCAILSARRIPVYEADSAAKRLYAKDDSLLDSIEEAYGCGIRLPGGALDTRKLAGIAFSSPEKLRILEGIVHPAVLKDFLRWRALQATLHADMPFCVIESAIILSKPEFLSKVDKVVLVEASLSTRLKRACERDGVEPEEIIRRMSAQHFDLSKVDAILRNEGTASDLESETDRVFRTLDLR
ncbi:MAG: dephospho-CoA kinase [Bacteroidales bacterium]|nr:dephospho-CoA kinase [Bacteroidales bacterium]